MLLPRKDGTEPLTFFFLFLFYVDCNSPFNLLNKKWLGEWTEWSVGPLLNDRRNPFEHSLHAGFAGSRIETVLTKKLLSRAFLPPPPFIECWVLGSYYCSPPPLPYLGHGCNYCYGVPMAIFHEIFSWLASFISLCIRTYILKRLTNQQ